MMDLRSSPCSRTTQHSIHPRPAAADRRRLRPGALRWRDSPRPTLRAVAIFAVYSHSACSAARRQALSLRSVQRPARIARKISASRVAPQCVSNERHRTISVDDILYGYDLLFEHIKLFGRSPWMGVLNMQDPSDAMVIADLVWSLKPDLFIEIGNSGGGGAIFVRSIMRVHNPDSILLSIDIKDWTEQPGGSLSSLGPEAVKKMCPQCIKTSVHPFWKESRRIIGASTDPKVIQQIKDEYVSKAKVVMVNVGGDHSSRGVFQDLKNFGSFVTNGSYVISQDAKLDRILKSKMALAGTRKFMAEQQQIFGGTIRFETDRSKHYFLYTHHPEGFLQRVQ